MVAVAASRGPRPTPRSVRTCHRTRRCAPHEAFSVLLLCRTCLHHTTQQRTRRSHVPNPLLPPHRRTIIITHPPRPNYARVWIMHGRLVSAPTHSNTLLMCHRLGMHPVPLALPPTSSCVFAVNRTIRHTDAAGSASVLTRSLCLGFGGVRHPTPASLTPRHLISSRTDWPGHVDNRPPPDLIETMIQVGKAPLIPPRTQARREAQTLHHLVHPYRRSE